VVKQAEQQILARELSGAENKEYLAMDGLPAFNKATAKLLFGDLPALADGRVATIQGLSVRHAPRRPGCRRAAAACCPAVARPHAPCLRSCALGPRAQGTGSLRLGAAFIAKFMPGRVRAVR
jgi:hypothetical protein